MPNRPRSNLPVTFPGLQGAVKTELERFARAVQVEFDARRDPDLRPLSGSTEPLGVDGVYYLDVDTRPLDRDLPSLRAEDAGRRITFIRRTVGTAVVRAMSPATVSGQPFAFVPNKFGAFDLTWDGSNWYFFDPPPRVQSSWASADQLRGGPFPASLGVSGSATLIQDPAATGVTVRGFGPGGHDAVRREFLVPTGTQGQLALRTYYRAQSGPAAHAVVHRRLHARQFDHGTGVPSGYRVFTLPSVTMPSGSAHWQYREDRVPLNQLGITQGRVEVVFSRPSAFPHASPDLDSMLLVESLLLEVEP